MSSLTHPKHGPFKHWSPFAVSLIVHEMQQNEGRQQEPVGILVFFFFFQALLPIRQGDEQMNPRFENVCFANNAYSRNNDFHSWEGL